MINKKRVKRNSILIAIAGLLVAVLVFTFMQPSLMALADIPEREEVLCGEADIIYFNEEGTYLAPELDETRIIAEYVDMRTATSMTFIQADGMYVLKDFGVPLHYNIGGMYNPIDNTINENLTNTSNSFGVSFSDGSRDALVQIEGSAGKLSMTPINDNIRRPQASSIYVFDGQQNVTSVRAVDSLLSEKSYFVNERLFNEQSLVENNQADNERREDSWDIIDEATYLIQQRAKEIERQLESGELTRIQSLREHTPLEFAHIELFERGLYDLNIHDNTLHSRIEDAFSRNSSAILFTDVFDGVDIQYILEGQSLKEYIIVYRPLAEYVFRFELVLDGLFANLVDGEILITDHRGDVVYLIPKGYMRDYAGIHSDAVFFNLEDLGYGRYIFTITADEIFFETAQFPVFIDPTIAYFGNNSGLFEVGNHRITRNEHNSGIGNFNTSRISIGFSYNAYINLHATPINNFLRGKSVVYARFLFDYIANYTPSFFNVIPELRVATNPSTLHSAAQIRILPRNITSVGNNNGSVEIDVTTYITNDLSRGIISLWDNNMSNSLSRNTLALSRPSFRLVFRDARGINTSDYNIKSDLGSHGNIILSLNEGSLNYTYESVRTNDGFMPIVVSHIYDANFGGGFFVGYNFRTNFHQTLRQNNGVFYYTNAAGRRYYFYPSKHNANQLANDELGLWLHTRHNGNTLTHKVLIDREGNSLVFSRFGHLIEIHQFPSTFENPQNGLLLRINYHNQPVDRTQVNTYRIANITNTHSTISFVYDTSNTLWQLQISQQGMAISRVLVQYGYTSMLGRRHLSSFHQVCSTNNNIDILTLLSYSGVRLSGIDYMRNGSHINLVGFLYNVNGRVSRITKRNETGTSVQNDIVNISYINSTQYNSDFYPRRFHVQRSVILNSSATRMRYHVSFDIRNRVISSYEYQNSGTSATGLFNPLRAESNGFDYFDFVGTYGNTRDIYFNTFAGPNNQFSRVSGDLPGLTQSSGISGYNTTSGLFPANSTARKTFGINNISSIANRYAISFWARTGTIGSSATIRVIPNGQNNQVVEYRFNSHTTEWQFGALILNFRYLNTVSIEVSTINGAWNIDNIRMVELPDGPSATQQSQLDHAMRRQNRYNSCGQIVLLRTANHVDGRIFEFIFNYGPRNTALGYPGRLESIVESVYSGGRWHQESRITYHYNARGHLSSIRTFGRSANQFISSQTFHNDGRLASVTDENGTTTIVRNNAAANSRIIENISLSSPESVIISKRVDITTGLLEAVSTGNITTSFGYNNSGMLNRITHNGFNTSFNYFNDGSLQSISVPGRTLVSYTYSRNQRTTTFGDWDTIQYNYDADGRLISMINKHQMSNLNTTFAYSNRGNLTSILHASGLSYSFIHYYNLTTAQQARNLQGIYTMQNGSNTLRVEYGLHNARASNPTRAYYFQNNRQSSHVYAHNFLEQTTEITRQNAVGQFHDIFHTYDDSHRLSSIQTIAGNNRFETTYQYHVPNSSINTNLINRTHFYVNNNNQQTTRYSYHLNGNLHRIYRGNYVVAEFHYDQYNRLVLEIYPMQNRRFETVYDAGGNILTRNMYGMSGFRFATNTWQYNDPHGWRDLLTSHNGQAIVYDSAGNPMIYRGNHLHWENGRRLARFNGERLVSFEYDFAGMRTRKVTAELVGGGGGIIVIPPRWEIVSDIRFLLEGSRVLGQVEMMTGEMTWFYYDTRGISGMRFMGVDYYFERNILGSVVGIWNMGNGQLVGRQGFDAWGNELYMTVEGIAGSAGYNSNRSIMEFNPFRWKGYYYDVVTGFYYLQSRYYDPVIGRFINADYAPMLFTESLMPMGANLFMYCFNNPVMFRDDAGYGPILAMLLVGLGVGALFGGIAGGVDARMAGDNFWAGFVGGMLTGAAIGIALPLGALTFAGVLALPVGLALMSVLTVGAGMASHAINEAANGREITQAGLNRAALHTFARGLLNFGAGMFMARVGAWPDLTRLTSTPLFSTRWGAFLITRVLAGQILTRPLIPLIDALWRP